MKMNSTYTLVKRQDVSMVAKSGTAVVLSVVRLVITAGADLSAWQSFGSTLYDSANYLYKALVKIEEVDNKTKESIRDADKYYREKVMKGKELFFEKFKKLFSLFPIFHQGDLLFFPSGFAFSCRGYCMCALRFPACTHRKGESACKRIAILQPSKSRFKHTERATFAARRLALQWT